MRLSEAILSGACTISMEQGDIDSCALGGAANAVGVPSCKEIGVSGRYKRILDVWPWLDARIDSGPTYMLEITLKFDTDVCTGNMTMEQLVNYVRSVEPACHCNTFNCSCVMIKDQAAAMEAELSPQLCGTPH
jgi:hypothetical protein